MISYGKCGRHAWWAMALVIVLGAQEKVWAEEQPVSPSAQRVDTLHAQARTMARRVTASGRWVAREEVTVMAPLDSVRVREVLADVGMRVQQGQVLARLERNALSAQLEQSQQGIQRSRAERVHAQSHMKETASALERARRLQPDGAISTQELEAATAAYASAQAEYEQAQAAVKQMRAQTEAARIQLAHAEVRAPVAGLIVQRQVQTGALVNAQTPLFTLVRDGELEFSAQVPASVLSDISVGMPAQLTLSSRHLPGQVRQVAAAVDSDTGYGDVRITATDDALSRLRAGTTGSVQLSLDERQALALDARALRYGNDGRSTYVFVVGADQRVKRVDVSTGGRDGEWVEISHGVTPQDTVVLAGAALLSEGERVEGVPLATHTTASVQP